MVLQRAKKIRKIHTYVRCGSMSRVMLGFFTLIIKMPYFCLISVTCFISGCAYCDGFYLTIIPRVRMGSESIAHEIEGRMGY